MLLADAIGLVSTMLYTPQFVRGDSVATFRRGAVRWDGAPRNLGSAESDALAHGKLSPLAHMTERRMENARVARRLELEGREPARASRHDDETSSDSLPASLRSTSPRGPVHSSTRRSTHR